MKFRYLALITLFLLTASVTYADGLVPCGGPNEAMCRACDFVVMAQRIMVWFVAISASIVALMFAFGGMKMVMSAGNTGQVSEGKEMMTNSVIGFLILLGAWLVVNTVLVTVMSDGKGIDIWGEIECVDNPTMSATNTGTGSAVNTGTGSAVNTGVTGCLTSCVAIDPSITIKSTACSGGSTCTVSSEIAPDLASLDSKLDAAGVNWQITEAYPPTRTHQNPCHAAGTCVDANCIGGCSATQVKTFLDSAASSGLKAVYEVKTPAEKDTLVSSGVNPESVAVLGSWISAPHFSVYNK